MILRRLIYTICRGIYIEGRKPILYERYINSFSIVKIFPFRSVERFRVKPMFYYSHFSCGRARYLKFYDFSNKVIRNLTNYILAEKIIFARIG